MSEFIFFKGFFLSLSLIVALGAQNIFILRQGIAKNHIFTICTLCFVCDVILMNIGIFAVAGFLTQSKIFSLILAFCGIIFTLYYAFLSLKSVLKSHSKTNLNSEISLTYKKAIVLTLLVTLANPQVYLDTIFLVGAAALAFDFKEKILFSVGALSASFLWFYSLGYGAKILSSYIKPNIARLIDIFVAFIMCMVAYFLFLYVLEISNPLW